MGFTFFLRLILLVVVLWKRKKDDYRSICCLLGRFCLQLNYNFAYLVFCVLYSLHGYMQYKLVSMLYDYEEQQCVFIGKHALLIHTKGKMNGKTKLVCIVGGE